MNQWDMHASAGFHVGKRVAYRILLGLNLVHPLSVVSVMLFPSLFQKKKLSVSSYLGAKMVSFHTLALY